MYERFHCLMHASHRAVYGMLQQSFLSFKAIEFFVYEVLELNVVELREVLACEFFKSLDLLDKRRAYERSEIEVKGRNGLAAVHLVLCGLERDARDDRRGLDAFGRTRFAMPGYKAVL